MRSDLPSILSPDEVKEDIKRKGWKVSSIAQWWDVSTVYVSRIINDPNRKRHWDDALRGLPQCPRNLRA
ncbi:hypothetical protein [Stutzerimonas stutzeri]|uniref:hypothetical protein n=1 Tax=Stutzerimonas stutzeri TaxID=316 RepID=UPI0015E3D42B|nr:hypothetical protein [Stutzerimonas stutzeri]MBA1280305.1 hypothetical protein [Stutzerimonas stutzeri]